MRRTIYFYILLLLSVFCNNAFAQQNLSLSEAIELGLKNNYQIEIAQRNVEIAQNNNVWKATGRFPTVNFSLSNENTFSGQNNPAGFLREFNSLSGGLAGNVNASYTIFDGYTYRINKNRLATLEAQSLGNVQVAIENTVQAIILAYYNVSIQIQNIATIQELLELSRDRIEYQEVKREFGQAGKFDLLQSEDAYFNDSATYLIQLNNYDLAMQNLNLAMGQDEVNQEYNLTDPLEFSAEAYAYATLEQKMLSSNQNLRNLYVAQRLSSIQTEAANTARYPTISVNGGLGLGGNLSRLNVIKPSTFMIDNPNQTSNYNAFINFTASYNIYDGGTRKRNVQNAEIQEQIAQLNIEDAKRQLSNQLSTTLASYNNQVQLLQITGQRMENAKENLVIAEERFKAAQINSFDYRTIQLNYLNATQSNLQAVFNLKNTETELIRLTGGLIR